jgi:hypothetical protein
MIHLFVHSFTFRLQTLEEVLADKDKQLSQMNVMLQKLKEDFKYNLKLLEERDQELERYDLGFSGIKKGVYIAPAQP